MENKTLKYQRLRILKSSQQQHKLLIKKYKTDYNPLILPKIAILGHRITPDAQWQVFHSKLLLFDRNLIKKENKFIFEMKNVLKLKQEQFNKKNDYFLSQMLTNVSKQIDLNFNLQEGRYKYSQILINRLKDLNQFICHIERFHKQPELQKQCRTLLQLEINKLSKSISEYEQKKQNALPQSQNSKTQVTNHYFHISDFKQTQKKSRNQSIKKMYEQKQQSKADKYKRIKTELSSTNFASEPLNLKYTSRKSQIQQITSDLRNENKQQNSLDIVFPKKKESKQIRLSNCTSQKRNNHPNLSATHRVSSIINNQKYKKRFTQIKTQVNQISKINKKMYKQVKSVRYNIQQEANKQNFSSQDQQVASKKSKSPQNKKEKTQKSLKQTESAKSCRSKKTTKKDNNSSAKSIRFDDQNIENDLQERAGNQNLEKINTNDNASLQLKTFLKRKQTFRGGKLLLKDSLKYSNNNISFKDLSQRDRSHSNESKYSKQSNKPTLRREGVQESNNFLINKYRTNVRRSKRKGKILGLQANKNLQRLLKQTNLQNFINPNQGHSMFFIEDRQSKNKLGNSSKQKKNNDKHVISTKNKIMMEIDVEAGFQETILQNKEKKDTVKNYGFTVKPSQLGTIRTNYVHVSPYHQKQIAHYYGGSQIQQINYQFITNQLGQYSFNRQFIQKAKKDDQQDYIPYQFRLIDPYDHFSIQLGKQIIKNHQQIQQKSINHSVSS